MKYPRRIEQRMRLLKDSCHRFDLGDLDHIMAASWSLRLLLHDGQSNKSLLKMFRLKDNLLFHDTCNPQPPQVEQIEWSPYCGLVFLDSGFKSGHFGYRAPLSLVRTMRRVTFQEWWDQVVYDERGSHPLTRGRLLLDHWHKDGVFHLDEAGMSAAYRAVARSKHVNVFSGDERGELHPAKPLYTAAIRQIAHEVLVTLDDTHICLPPIEIDFADEVLPVGFVYGEDDG